MEINSDEEGASHVEEVASVVDSASKPNKAAAEKKAPVRRKKATAKSKRRKAAAEPVAKPTEQPLTMQEVGESLGKAKAELVGAIAEPALKALGRWSEMARDALSGAVGGFLGNKKRED